MWGLALMGASALMGAQRAQRQAEADKQYNLAQAEVTRYSPWTGMQGQMKPQSNQSWLEGAVGGGIQGAAMAQGLNMGFGGPKSAATGMGSAWDDLATGQTQPTATLYGRNPFGAA